MADKRTWLKSCDGATRKHLIERLRQPDPEAEQARQITAEKEMTEMGKTHADMAKTRAEIEKVKSETFENVTDAARNLAGLGRGPIGGLSMPRVPRGSPGQARCQ